MNQPTLALSTSRDWSAADLKSTVRDYSGCNVPKGPAPYCSIATIRTSERGRSIGKRSSSSNVVCSVTLQHSNSAEPRPPLAACQARKRFWQGMQRPFPLLLAQIQRTCDNRIADRPQVHLKTQQLVALQGRALKNYQGSNPRRNSRLTRSRRRQPVDYPEAPKALRVGCGSPLVEGSAHPGP